MSRVPLPGSLAAVSVPPCAQTSGSGIGLAIAAELVWAHGGALTAASEPGKGTRLTLTLPRA